MYSLCLIPFRWAIICMDVVVIINKEKNGMSCSVASWKKFLTTSSCLAEEKRGANLNVRA